MPPSRRSSSSHSSSRSHSSHSSHSSSRSHSSRSYSSHSSSSYSRGSGSFGGYSGNRSPRGSTPRTIPTPPRPRSNQPRGYDGVIGSSLLRSSVHDYYYYPKSWVDEETGTYYKNGYYDENGQHYDHVTIKDGANYETLLACSYCGTNIKLKWTEGAIPSCPNCGALLNEVTDNAVVEDKLKDKVVYSSPASGSKMNLKPMIIVLCILGAFTVLPFVFVFMFAFIAALTGSTPKTTTTTTTTSAYVEEVSSDNSIYVNEIGRECYWDDEYECYYDQTSDCYFYFNDDVEPPEWQYWYEGISSDYGDYGWMAYDYDEEQWYIEDSSGWIILPDSYNISELWHFDEMGTGKYNGENSIYIESIDRTCEWIPDEQAYYDEESDCYFIYNDYVDPPVWQYWYNGISGSDEFEGYGWMEYDEDEDSWYIEANDGWHSLDEYDFDTDALWHMN